MDSDNNPIFELGDSTDPTLYAMDMNEVLQMMSTRGVLIDVRTEEEYVAGHAPGSLLIDPASLRTDPRAAIFGDDPLAEPDITPVIVLCASGHRAQIATEMLRIHGLVAYYLDGGLRAWVQSGQILLPGPPRNKR